MTDTGVSTVEATQLLEQSWISKALEVGGLPALVLMLIALLVVIYLWKVAPIRAARKSEPAESTSPLPEIATVEKVKKLITEEIAPIKDAVAKLEREVQEAMIVARSCPLHMENVDKDITHLTDNIKEATASLNSAITYCQKRLDDLMLQIAAGK